MDRPVSGILARSRSNSYAQRTREAVAEPSTENAPLNPLMSKERLRLSRVRRKLLNKVVARDGIGYRYALQTTGPSK